MRYPYTVLVVLTGLTLLFSIQAFSVVPITNIAIGVAASSGGSWSGGNPDIWTATTTGSNLNKTEIETRLNAGISVTISATGYVLLNNMAIKKTAGGDATIKFKAGSFIEIDPSDSISSSAGKLHMIFNADANGDGDGYIFAYTNSNDEYFASNGGDIVFGGGSDPYTSFAYGSSSAGIELHGPTVSAGAGSIIIHGRGNGGSDLEGVSFVEPGNLITTTGNITIVGVGSSSSSSSGSGVRMVTSGNVQTTSGTITITGTSGTGTGSASGNPGVYITYGSTISSTTGPINITGTCGDAFNGLSVGVWMGGVSGLVPSIQTVDGAITVIGTSTTMSSSSSSGF